MECTLIRKDLVIGHANIFDFATKTEKENNNFDFVEIDASVISPVKILVNFYNLKIVDTEFLQKLCCDPIEFTDYLFSVNITGSQNNNLPKLMFDTTTLNSFSVDTMGTCIFHDKVTAVGFYHNSMLWSSLNLGLSFLG